MFLPLFSLCWLMFFCSLLPPCIDFQNNRNANEKEAPFSWTFDPSLHWINTLQTVCNGTNGRHATLQRLNLPLCTHVSPSRDPRPPPQTHLQTPTLKRNFFWKFFLSYKKEHASSSEFFFEIFLPNFFWKNSFPLIREEGGIYYQSKKILWWWSATTLFLLQCNTESEEKSSFQPLPLIVFEAHVLFHKTGERYALFEAHLFLYLTFFLLWSGYDIFPFI